MAIVFAGASAAVACKSSPSGGGDAAASASGAPVELSAGASAAKALPTSRQPYATPDGPSVGAIAGQVNLFSSPNSESRRLGYLHLGAIVKRDPEPVSRGACPGGWYKVYPRGYVCHDENATSLDPNHPVLRAASILRPNLAAALPYHYGFVRAVLPLYLRVPSEKDQYASEMSLKEHLETWASSGAEMNKVALGSFDVPVDARGVPIVGKKVGDVPHPSTSLTQGELFGGQSDNDPIPFWLAGGKRSIPNVADFKVPEYAAFADRARRHTGLAFASSFPTGPESLERRFAVTTDLRLAPTTKVKPDTGSPWHGIELLDPAHSPPLPFAWVRTNGVQAYRFGDGDGDKPRPKADLDRRTVVLLTGKRRKGADGFYWEMKNGMYIRAAEAGVVRQPDEWPDAAKKGLKWVEVSIESQSLILWEGQKPVYATLVSTGQDGMKDPKTTKSTVRGVFNIRSKHLTATMDSNERSGAGGGKRPEVAAGGGEGDDKKADKADKGDKPSAKSDKGDAKSKSSGKTATAGHDADYGVTRRRGEGTFWLRDVPYVQYFESGYALHVAYWHDVFGVARSHGCINLSPIDGRWIFQWTDPPVPEGWHGVLSGDMGEGTVVIVHE